MYNKGIPIWSPYYTHVDRMVSSLSRVYYKCQPSTIKPLLFVFAFDPYTSGLIIGLSNLFRALLCQHHSHVNCFPSFVYIYIYIYRPVA